MKKSKLNSRDKISLLIVAVFLSLTSISQTIAENAFDKYDSVHVIKTTRERLSRKGKLDVKITDYIFLAKKYKMAAQPFEPTIYFWFSPDYVISVRKGDASAKVEFDDGTIKEYLHVGDTKIYGSDEMGSIYIVVEEEDKLYSHNIKSIRLSFSDGDKDYVIDDKKQGVVKELLQLVKDAYIIAKR